MGGSRGETGGGGSEPPQKNHKNIGSLSNTGPDPLKNHKATKQAFNIGQSSARQLLKWRFAGRPMMAHLKLYLDPLSRQTKKERKKKQKKQNKRYQIWTPSDKNFWIGPWARLSIWTDSS